MDFLFRLRAVRCRARYSHVKISFRGTCTKETYQVDVRSEHSRLAQWTLPTAASVGRYCIINWFLFWILFRMLQNLVVIIGVDLNKRHLDSRTRLCISHDSWKEFHDRRDLATRNIAFPFNILWTRICFSFHLIIATNIFI